MKFVTLNCEFMDSASDTKTAVLTVSLVSAKSPPEAQGYDIQIPSPQHHSATLKDNAYQNTKRVPIQNYNSPEINK